MYQMSIVNYLFLSDKGKEKYKKQKEKIINRKTYIKTTNESCHVTWNLFQFDST